MLDEHWDNKELDMQQNGTERDCVSCGGQKTLPCGDCDGKGRSRRFIFLSQCQRCSGQGRLQCLTCVPPPKAHGDGPTRGRGDEAANLRAKHNVGNVDEIAQAPGNELGKLPMRLAVVVNLEWKGVLGDHLGYVLQTNGVSVDGTEIRYLDSALDSLSRDMTADHRALADKVAGSRSDQYLKTIKAISPRGLHSRIYIYGHSLR